jgi:hypothetical protein
MIFETVIRLLIQIQQDERMDDFFDMRPFL